MSEQATKNPERADIMAAIKTRRLAGVALGDIAAELGLKKWAVSQACQRMNLTVKAAQFEKPIQYDHVPYVKRRCVVCRGESMLHPVSFTCDYCKSVQDKIDTACWDR